MTDCNTRNYSITLPEDTADLFDTFCAEQPKSPVDNIASRLIRNGIETVLMLHPDWQERLDYEPHEQSEAARLARASMAAPIWRPLEAAPKDGSDFLGRFDNGEIIMCYYLDNSDTPWPWAGFRPRHGAETPGRTLIECMPLSALEGSAL